MPNSLHTQEFTITELKKLFNKVEAGNSQDCIAAIGEILYLDNLCEIGLRSFFEVFKKCTELKLNSRFQMQFYIPVRETLSHEIVCYLVDVSKVAQESVVNLVYIPLAQNTPEYQIGKRIYEGNMINNLTKISNFFRPVELKIIEYAVQGHTSKMMAKALSISHFTVDKLRRGIYDKAALKNKRDLYNLALRLNFVPNF